MERERENKRKRGRRTIYKVEEYIRILYGRQKQRQ